MASKPAGSEGKDGGALPQPARSRLRMAFQKLGGKRLLGLEVRSEADFAKLIEVGVPVASLSELAEHEGLGQEEIDRIIIPRRTLSHRKAKGQPLNRAESERAIRVASITSLAEETFANPEKGRAWLRRPTTALGGKRPLDLLDSEPGGRVVEQLLYRIGHGITA
jgi:putative toxin-antitoxin system antitoxin component (TIGR02293 family)